MPSGNQKNQTSRWMGVSSYSQFFLKYHLLQTCNTKPHHLSSYKCSSTCFCVINETCKLRLPYRLWTEEYVEILLYPVLLVTSVTRQRRMSLFHSLYSLFPWIKESDSYRQIQHCIACNSLPFMHISWQIPCVVDLWCSERMLEEGVKEGRWSQKFASR